MRNPAKAKEMATKHEGRKNKLYLDSEGIVTIGIGNALRSPAQAQALKSWTHSDGRPATADEIAAAFAIVFHQPKGFRAEHYFSFTDISISEDEIDQLWDQTFAAFEAGLCRVFPKFESWPEGPQLAAFDIEYQAGEAGIKHGFPHLCAALNSDPPDFETAANESHRAKSSDERNEDTKELFLSGVPVHTGPGA